MHPFLQNRTLFISYLAGWTVPTFVLLNVFIIEGGIPPGKAILFGIPLSLVYAFLGFPIYYVCGGNPLGGARYPRALAAHLTAAIMYGTLWQLIARFSGKALEQTGWGAEYGAVWDLARTVFGIGVLSYFITAGVFYATLAKGKALEAERDQAKLKVQATSAELQALRAQINPHFLFNSLHSISALTLHEPEKARTVCVRLADLLRLTLGLGEKRLIRLDQEFEIVENYLEIEQYRLGDRLKCDIRIDDDCRNLLVPPLVVQPLVENAILHGIATIPEGGLLEITVTRRDNDLFIQVRNPYDPEAPKRPGAGTGQRNLRSRIKTQFGTESAFTCTVRDNRYEATVTLPVLRGGSV